MRTMSVEGAAFYQLVYYLVTLLLVYGLCSGVGGNPIGAFGGGRENKGSAIVNSPGKSPPFAYMEGTLSMGFRSIVQGCLLLCLSH